MSWLRRTMLYSIIAAMLLTVSAFMFWRTNQQGDPRPVGDPLALGSQVYAANCAACHGQNGEGHAAVEVAPALDASEHAWHHPDGQLQELILEGGQIMPAFKGRLTHEEVVAVIRFIQSWWAPGQLQSQQSMSQQFPLQN